MAKHRDWEGIREFISKGRNFIITTHVNPDGDAIGSQVAISHYLRGIGKNVSILNCSPTPKFYRFLDPENQIVVFDKERYISKFAWADGCIVLDVSDWNRLRGVGQALKLNNLPIVCIDHHMFSDAIGEVQVMDETASSTGEMLYDFFVDSNVEIDRTIADALYTCILSDTGSFRFSNTTPHAHHVAAELIAKGADFRKIYREAYESFSVDRMKLIGHVWGNMHFEFDNKLAWYSVTQDILKSNHLIQSDLEGFSEIPRVVEGVEVNLFFMELENGKIKVSFRSKGAINVLEAAQKFNGGGHKFAAGTVIDGPLEIAQQRVLAEIRPLILGHR